MPVCSGSASVRPGRRSQRQCSSWAGRTTRTSSRMPQTAGSTHHYRVRPVLLQYSGVSKKLDREGAPHQAKHFLWRQNTMRQICGPAEFRAVARHAGVCTCEVRPGPGVCAGREPDTERL
eukprot:gene9038-biopygen1640